MADQRPSSDATAPPPRRRVLKTLDSRFVVPDDLDPIRILQTLQVANNDGGTGWHYEFVTLCEEVDTNV